MIFKGKILCTYYFSYDKTMRKKLKFPLRTVNSHFIDTGLPPGENNREKNREKLSKKAWKIALI